MSVQVQRCILTFSINSILCQEQFGTTSGVHGVHTPANPVTCFKSESLDDTPRKLVLKEKQISERKELNLRDAILHFEEAERERERDREVRLYENYLGS